MSPGPLVALTAKLWEEGGGRGNDDVSLHVTRAGRLQVTHPSTPQGRDPIEIDTLFMDGSRRNRFCSRDRAPPKMMMPQRVVDAQRLDLAVFPEYYIVGGIVKGSAREPVNPAMPLSHSECGTRTTTRATTSSRRGAPRQAGRSGSGWGRCPGSGTRHRRPAPAEAAAAT